MPEEIIRFKCKGCEKTIKAKPKYAGRKISCPVCSQKIRVPDPNAKKGESTSAKQKPAKNSKDDLAEDSRGNSTVILKGSPPASEEQKRKAKKLGISFSEGVAERELAEAIEWEKKNRKKRLKSAPDQLDALMAELKPGEMMDEMLVRRNSGMMLIVDSDEYAGEVDNLSKCKFQIIPTDDVTEQQYIMFLRGCLAKIDPEFASLGLAGPTAKEARRTYDLDDDDDDMDEDLFDD